MRRGSTTERSGMLAAAEDMLAAADPARARAASRWRPRLRRAARVTRDPGQRPRVGGRLATFALLLVLAIALLSSAPGLGGVRDHVRHINPLWIVLAVTLELASNVSFVVLFRLFFDRLPSSDARLLAWTEQASGALLPGGGVGGLAIGGWLMHLTGARTAWIVRRSGGLFFLTTALNSAAIIGAGLALILGASGPDDLIRVVPPTALATVATAAVAALPLILRSRPHAPRWIRGISAGVDEAESTTFKRPSLRLIGGLGYLGFDIAVLWVCLAAVGGASSVPAVILAYNIGYLANALPIPGGIAVLDAGLTGALTLYGVSATHAAAAVVVYHAIALWTPSLGGLIAYLRLRPRLARAASTKPSIPSPDVSTPLLEGATP